MVSNIILFTAQWFTIQPDLFGRIEDEVGELGESERDFIRICTTALNSGRFAKYRWCGNGHPPSSRVAIFKMLVLKALRNFPTTKVTLQIVRQSPVLRRLCGWESVANVPSESTVSRAYDQFAQDEIASLVHADFVQASLGRDGVFHVSHDSSAIDAREKGQRKPQTDEEKAQTSLGAQRNRTADENFALLPQHCDWGCKRDSKGKGKTWRGYKLHVSCADGDIPLAAFLSSANLHDSKAMIPMMQKVSENFDYFYDLADAGYDAAEIRQASIDMQHVPIIDRNPRRGEKNVDDRGGRMVNIIDATTRRYFVRSGIERVFSHLHEAHGGKFVRVRGNKKVFLHLMFGLIVVTAEQIFSAAVLT